MARGGRRTGKPGVSYPNRTDLNDHGFTGQTYGEAKQQVDAVRAVPMASPTEGQNPLLPPQASPTAPKPGSMGDLFGPTQHPGEPVTAGAAAGLGPGPEVLGIKSPRDQDFDYLAARNIYPVLAWAAARRGGPSTVALVRNLRSGLT